MLQTLAFDEALQRVVEVVYRVDPDAIVILEVFSKKTNATPKRVIDSCKARLKQYDAAKE